MSVLTCGVEEYASVAHDEEEFEMQPTVLPCSREAVSDSDTAPLRDLDLEQGLSCKDAPIHFTEWGFLPIVLRDRYPGPDPRIPNDTAYLSNRDTSQKDGTYQNKLDSYLKEVGYWACFIFVTGTASGLVHLLAWNNHFPTIWELCATTPLYFTGRRLYKNAGGLFRRGRWEKRYGWDDVTSKEGMAIIPRLAFWAWAIVRMYVICALFTSLRSQPVQVYQTVDWVKAFPHNH